MLITGSSTVPHRRQELLQRARTCRCIAEKASAQASRELQKLASRYEALAAELRREAVETAA